FWSFLMFRPDPSRSRRLAIELSQRAIKSRKTSPSLLQSGGDRGEEAPSNVWRRAWSHATSTNPSPQSLSPLVPRGAREKVAVFCPALANSIAVPRRPALHARLCACTLIACGLACVGQLPGQEVPVEEKVLSIGMRLLIVARA